jgi:hypothetical protein
MHLHLKWDASHPRKNQTKKSKNERVLDRDDIALFPFHKPREKTNPGQKDGELRISPRQMHNNILRDADVTLYTALKHNDHEFV